MLASLSGARMNRARLPPPTAGAGVATNGTSANWNGLSMTSVSAELLKRLRAKPACTLPRLKLCATRTPKSWVTSSSGLGTSITGLTALNRLPPSSAR